MDQSTFRELLAKFHAELSKAHQADPTAHKSLGEILPDIQQLADRSGLDATATDATLPQRLESVAVQFEANHPALAGSVRRLVDLLSEVGI